MDRQSKYWHDVRQEETIFYNRQNGGVSLMVWACFSYHGASDFLFTDRRVASIKYYDVLQNGFLPFAAVTHGADWTFQQDSAPIPPRGTQVVFPIMALMSFLDRRILRTPTQSKIFGLYLRVMYFANGKHCATVDELKSVLVDILVKYGGNGSRKA